MLMALSLPRARIRDKDGEMGNDGGDDDADPTPPNVVFERHQE